MDLIGKLYIDYIIDEKLINGKSYALKNRKIGGLLNIFDDQKFLDLIDKNVFKTNLFLICNKENSSFIRDLDYSLDLNLIEIQESLPTAFIIESKDSRSSFVINDSVIKVDNFSKKSSAFCLFYGDKIKSNIFKNYERGYVDTAGNSYEDLLNLAVSNDFPDNTFISISNEYLDQKLINLFLENNFYTIIGHSPEVTEIYRKDFKEKIFNDFYLRSNQIKKDINITGLGDKFIFLVSIYNFYFNVDIIRAVKKAQKLINLFISI